MCIYTKGNISMKNRPNLIENDKHCVVLFLFAYCWQEYFVLLYWLLFVIFYCFNPFSRFVKRDLSLFSSSTGRAFWMLFLFMSTFSFTISFLNTVWRPRNSSVGFFNILHWNIGNRFFDLLSILWQNSISVQLNEYETDLVYLKLILHMTTDCLLIYVFLPVFTCSCVLWS